MPQCVLLAGFGATNRAVAKSLTARGHRVIVFDDREGDAGVSAAASELDLALEVAPDERRLRGLTRAAGVVIPTPGMPWNHAALATAEALGVPVASEFDLARVWDSRPLAAVTGTSGKTTTTEIAVAALRASGVAAAAAGNNDVPLVAAIDDSGPEVFVVEASSFRLSHTQRLEAPAACWVNFAPDHLDVHRDLAAYEAAKSRVWQGLPEGGIAVANREDPVVMGRVRDDRACWTFAATGHADWRAESGMLIGPPGAITGVSELRRAMPHDISNALAAAATASAVGATACGVREALASYEPGAHRLQWIASISGVDYYNDSKATTPHATVAALRGLGSAKRRVVAGRNGVPAAPPAGRPSGCVVLIAGGRNKGMDMSALAGGVEHIHAVIAMGEAAAEVAEVFEGARPVLEAAGMEEAVAAAASVAGSGMAVLLSPACASFDAYSDHAERGADFARIVKRSAGCGDTAGAC